MKRICLYGASENLGGTEIYLITMVRALKDEVRFDFLINHAYGAIPFEDEIESYGGKIYREYYKNSERKLSEYISPKNLLDMHPEWDGIYLNLQNIDTSYRLLVEARKRGLSYRILHSHSCNYMNAVSVKDKIYEQFYKITRKFVLSHKLACSKAAGIWMFGKKAEVTVIPNAIDFQKFCINDSVRLKMRENYHIMNDEIVIGFCGRLDDLKRPDFLMDIFLELEHKQKYKLLFVGEGNLRKNICERAEKSGVLDCVIFTGTVNNIETYYQMMDCFVLPSKFEGFGIVLIEAQASGLRCYAMDGAVPYETNITGRVEFVPADQSASQWAHIIQKKGFDRVNCLDILEKSNYTVDAMRMKLLNVFQNK